MNDDYVIEGFLYRDLNLILVKGCACGQRGITPIEQDDRRIEQGTIGRSAQNRGRGWIPGHKGAHLRWEAGTVRPGCFHPPVVNLVHEQISCWSAGGLGG